MTLPGVYSVIVPPPSVVVVVVVVLEVCAQANGATNASAMLSIVFFTFILPFGFPLNAERQETPPHSGRRRPLYLYFGSDGASGPSVRNDCRYSCRETAF